MSYVDLRLLALAVFPARGVPDKPISHPWSEPLLGLLMGLLGTGQPDFQPIPADHPDLPDVEVEQGLIAVVGVVHSVSEEGQTHIFKPNDILAGLVPLRHFLEMINGVGPASRTVALHHLYFGKSISLSQMLARLQAARPPDAIDSLSDPGYHELRCSALLLAGTLQAGVSAMWALTTGFSGPGASYAPLATNILVSPANTLPAHMLALLAHDFNLIPVGVAKFTASEMDMGHLPAPHVAPSNASFRQLLLVSSGSEQESTAAEGALSQAGTPRRVVSPSALHRHCVDWADGLGFELVARFVRAPATRSGSSDVCPLSWHQAATVVAPMGCVFVGALPHSRLEMAAATAAKAAGDSPEAFPPGELPRPTLEVLWRKSARVTLADLGHWLDSGAKRGYLLHMIQAYLDTYSSSLPEAYTGGLGFGAPAAAGGPSVLGLGVAHAGSHLACWHLSAADIASQSGPLPGALEVLAFGLASG
ncbi:hypothetical protein H696_01023 [Fonticula alba]|uniref:Uncharacterized protein n=1 Tax=Fonticula alba TaxID=691883 RepID=A0A058ZB06_FONAL|nr:hypothetical protein H696_01023 [Fonticula alba]KCV71605.1 hypothetical protein H696_01023 [Fonticula alba]|eukprot:XP_009493183.1 hypothetical protein H696_01023 [Fonticula alba]